MSEYFQNTEDVDTKIQTKIATAPAYPHNTSYHVPMVAMPMSVVHNAPCCKNHDTSSCRISTRSSTSSTISSEKKMSKKWKRIFTLFFIVIVICFIAWECLAYFDFKGGLEKRNKEVDGLLLRVSQLETELSDKKAMRQSGKIYPLPAVHLVGKGNGSLVIERSKTYGSSKILPLCKWNLVYKTKTIRRHRNGYIEIKHDGIYKIYVQFVMKGNRADTNDTFYHFNINRDDKALAKTSMSRDQCLPFCAKYVSTVVHLSKGDTISVSPDVANLEVLMDSEKTMFGVFMISSHQQKNPEAVL